MRRFLSAVSEIADHTTAETIIRDGVAVVLLSICMCVAVLAGGVAAELLILWRLG